MARPAAARCASTALILLGGLACRTPESSPPPAAAPGSHVTVPLDQLSNLTPERQRMLDVLDASSAQVQPCYLQALERDPLAYGDLIVRLSVAADGAVEAVEAEFTTLRDRAFEACVVDVVRALRFPAPSKAGLTLRYPYVFTTELTPPEVTRALLLRHGLIDEAPLATDPQRVDEEAPPPPGTVQTW